MDPIEYVKPFYAEEHRFYHNMAHIQKVLEHIGENVSDELYFAALFHDIYYDPYGHENEEKSCQLFRQYAEKHKLEVDISRVSNLILATKNHLAEHDDFETNLLISADMSVLEGEDILKYENGIFREYQKAGIADYRTKRVEFLNKVKEGYKKSAKARENCARLINYIRQKEYNIGIYAGSFNPFHIGHLDIVRQSEKIFDKVVIAQGINADKPMPEKLSAKIRQVVHYEGLITSLFNQEDKINKVLIRGLRNSFDVGYEDNLRNTILDIRDVNIIYFFCKKSHEHISSSMIRSLYPFGESYYQKYIPEII